MSTVMNSMIPNQLPRMDIESLMLTGSKETQSKPSLEDVIKQLLQELTKSGSLDESSPLGKMLAQHMQEKGIQGSRPEDLKKGLESLISDKLGPNFGAADSAGLNGGSQQDLMSKVLNGLAKSSLDDLLSKQGEGTTFSQSDMPMLEKIAEFMDKFPKDFPPPDSGSWKNELKEDNYLSEQETGDFRAALDKLGSQLQANASEGSQGLGQGGGGFGLGDSGALGNQNSPGGAGQPLQGGSVDELAKLLSALIEKGLEATLAEGGNGGVGNGQPQGAGQHTLNSSAAETANALVQALLQGGGLQTQASS